MAVQWLDGGVGVENPGGVKQPSHTVGQVRIQPSRAFGFRDAFERIAQRVFGDDLLHIEQTRIHPVAAYRSYMRVAFVTRQNREQPSAQHLCLARRIRAAVTQWAAFQPARLQSCQRKKFDEVGQLPHRRCRAFGIPSYLNSPRHRLHASARQKHFFALRQLQFRLTHRVTPMMVTNPLACLSFKQIAHRQLRFLG